jgi:hypothetical protein
MCSDSFKLAYIGMVAAAFAFGFFAAATTPGIFGSDECRQRLVAIKQHTVGRFKEEANVRGYYGEQEVAEFIERSVRRLYLEEVRRLTEMHLTGTHQFLKYLKVQNVFRLPRSLRRERILETAKELEQLSLGENGLKNAPRPLLAELVESRPPESLQKAEHLKMVMALRYYLAFIREASAQQFLETLPMDRQVLSHDPEVVQRIVSNLSEQAYETFTQLVQLLPNRTGTAPVEPVPESEYEPSLVKLFESAVVPGQIKQELQLQKNFEQKYSASPSRLQRRFVAELLAFFELS